ncbi:MAG: tRNA pseudouridine(38-40) synthase TruA [Muribaculaceae bacterium]|nr:tRNA pseudouridine(38-40) synthase TruA [Muribaculaceae bacterium]MDE6753940.1 tRNA pseudouridine(38-40) synthase TruA [Muribaculaceae bacterium]
MRYFLKLAYNGSKFHGWQIQPNAESVQQKIEEALSILTRLPISIVGAGRTDTGVHAREMFAHFDIPYEINDKKRFLLSLNKLIGKDIAFYDLIKVHEDAHARFDATARTYKYFVSYDKTPFFYPFSYQSPVRLDIDKMNKAASVLLEIEDFTSFAKLHSDAKTNICNVTKALWTDNKDELPIFIKDGIVFTISADRFLRNMVRAVVGTLVDVGRDKINIVDFKNIIQKKDRCAAGISMPAEALFLWSVHYPYIQSDDF